MTMPGVQGQTVYDMLVDLAQTLRAMQISGENGDEAALSRQREHLKAIGRKILQENNGHVDVQVNMQGDTAGALVLLFSVDALYVPYNLG